MDIPTKAEKNRLVKALANYVLKDGSHIRHQQRAYDRYMAVFEMLEAKYPQIAFRAEESMASLTRAAKTEASKKVFRGPGATS